MNTKSTGDPRQRISAIADTRIWQGRTSATSHRYTVFLAESTT